MHGPNRVGMASFNPLVPGDHPYRKVFGLVDFQRLCEPIADLDNTGRVAKGFGVVTLYRCLLLQFMEALLSL